MGTMIMRMTEIVAKATARSDGFARREFLRTRWVSAIFGYLLDFRGLLPQ